MRTYWLIPCPSCEEPIFAYIAQGHPHFPKGLYSPAWAFVHLGFYCGYNSIGGDYQDPREMPDWLGEVHRTAVYQQSGRSNTLHTESLIAPRVMEYSVWIREGRKPPAEYSYTHPEWKAVRRVLKLCGL